MRTDLLSRHFASMAYNNAWANHRLYKACASLSQAEFLAPRTGFFPSIRATLTHVLQVDAFYLDALEREARGEWPNPDIAGFFADDNPYPTSPELHAAQRALDLRLVVYCQALQDATLERIVTILRASGPQTDTRSRLLAHVFQHQIHHRGQAHAMLSGTHVKPPQLDEFFCAMDAPLRQQDLGELGWSEAQVWPQG